MKTINSGSKEMKLFLDGETLTGFAGPVKVFKKDVYVNTKTGVGYDKVIKELGNLINFIAHKYHFDGFAVEDTKQHIIVHILEGIPKFDPRKNVKLSTFIQMRVTRRLINEIRNDAKRNKNATMLNVYSYTFSCVCDNTEVAILGAKEKIEKECSHCGKLMTSAKRNAIQPCEIPINNLIYGNNQSIDIDDQNGLFKSSTHQYPLDEAVTYSYDLNKWLEKEDPAMAKIIELMCIHDYSINEAARKVGMSGAWANLKLKNLRNKRIVKEIFGR